MRASLTFTVLTAALFAIAAGPASPQDAPQRKKGFGPGMSTIPGGQVTPHWMADDTKFWYRKTLKAGGKEFVLVNCETGKKEPAFDHQKLAAALSKAANTEFKADRL